MLAIPEIWKIYDFVHFFSLDSHLSDIEVSGIHNQSDYSYQKHSPNILEDSQDEEEIRNKKFLDEHSVSSNQRMSALID